MNLAYSVIKNIKTPTDTSFGDYDIQHKIEFEPDKLNFDFLSKILDL